MDRVRAVWSAFLRWWLGELRACIPPRLQRLLFRARNRLVFALGGDVLTVGYFSNGNGRELGRIPVADVPADVVATEVRDLLAGLDPGRRDVLLQVPLGSVLRRVVELPAAAEENLREVIAFDLERQTPFSAEQVYHDARVVRRMPERHRIAVELTVIPRAQVDPALDALQSWGVVVNGIEVADPVGPKKLIPLASQSAAAPAGRGMRIVTAALALVAAGLIVSLFAVPLVRQAREIEILAAEVAKAKKVAESARKTQEQIDHLTALDRFLIERKTARPPSVALLDELTRIVPDDSWLYRVRFNGDEVQTFGYSAAASNLIGPFETSPLFKDPQFMAPLMRDPRVDAERFTISLQVEKAPAQ
jgi:Tfp pilus assembly protein, ATPase PilM